MKYTPQIFQELKPAQFQTVRMFTANAANVGVVANLVAVNQGNADVNSGNIAPSYDRDSDYVRIALAPGVIAEANSYIAYDTFIPPNHVAQWQAISLAAGQSVFVYSLKGQTNFVLTGTTYDL